MNLFKLPVTSVQSVPTGLAKGKLQKKFPWRIQCSQSYCKGEKKNTALSAPLKKLYITNIQ